MKKSQIEKAVHKAIRMANKWTEGTVIIQILPTNRSLLVSHHIGNNWCSMGLNASESKDRILESFECGEHYDLNLKHQYLVDRIAKEIEDKYADVK